MKKDRAAMIRQFGQLPLPKSFLSNSSVSSNDCKDDMQNKPANRCISLSDFLDRKLDKTTHKTVQEKQKSFSLITAKSAQKHAEPRKVEPVPDFLLNGNFFQHIKQLPREEGFVGSSGREEYGEHITDEEDSRKRRNPFAIPKGADDRPTSSRLVVLGDDPKPKRAKREQWSINNRPEHLFNHYANGSGWWDCNMEGVDSDEVGCTEAWEGMGTTTLGGLEWN